jgi:predicted nucleic acid-binding protein
MKYLLDTCVISELVARQPNPKVIDWVDGIDPDSTYLSVITLGEIRKGIEKLPNSRRRETLQVWLTQDLLARFNGRILSIEIKVALTWGQLTGALEARGKRMAAMDSLLAATASYYHCSLVTRNVDDFQHAGIAMVNPWD